MNRTQVLDLLDFLDSSPCNFYAVDTLKTRLLAQGYQHLKAEESWDIAPGDKFFVTKNDSALFAFNIGSGELSDNGFRLICAHSDSPTFRIKPNAEMRCEGNILKLNTEVYGGPILYTWFDRPLSLAGRVILKSDNPLHPLTRLINIIDPVLLIPHLAIHFNRSVNEGNPLSKQKDMLPVAGMVNSMLEEKNYLLELISEYLSVSSDQILDFDLVLYEYQSAKLVGMKEEFISSGRLDDLAMVHAGLQAIQLAENTAATHVLAVFDNEESGSGTKQGAASPVLKNIMERICTALGGNQEDFYRAIENSFMISADMAHALHPNYPEKHDPTNHPIMGGGPVIKIHANQKYLTDAESAAVFKNVCELADVPCQYFVNHSDMAGGSTLGNILTSQMNMRGVDMGNPMWGMHSVRETACTEDHIYAIKAFKTFYEL